MILFLKTDEDQRENKLATPNFLLEEDQPVLGVVISSSVEKEGSVLEM